MGQTHSHLMETGLNLELDEGGYAPPLSETELTIRGLDEEAKEPHGVVRNPVPGRAARAEKGRLVPDRAEALGAARAELARAEEDESAI